MSIEYVVPSRRSDAFHCPYCSAYSQQTWARLYPRSIGTPTQSASTAITHNMLANSQKDEYAHAKSIDMCTCTKCKSNSVWFNGEMLYPSANGPMPSADMPENVKADFLEAREIVSISPRAAVALLRLAMQKLVVELGEKGRDLFLDIGNLVKKGMPEKLQKAADSVRVIGNSVVHPGQIDLRDDTTTAIALFHLLNVIVEVMITQPKRIDELYSKIPDSAKDAIDKRDSRF